MKKDLWLRNFITGYFCIFVFCLLIYPAWFIFDAKTDNICFYFALNLYLIAILFSLTIFFKNFLKSDYSCGEIKTGVNQFDKTDMFFLSAAFLISFAANYYPVFYLPVQSVGDQFYHSFAVCPMIDRANIVLSKMGIDYGIAVKLFIGLAVIIYILRKKIFNANILTVESKSYYYIFAAVLIILVITSGLLLKMGFYDNLGSYKNHIFQYPTMSKVPFLIWYGIFGTGTAQANSLQLFLVMLGGAYIYKIIEYNFKDKYVSFCGVLIYLFIPLIYYFSHVTYLSAGEIFLATAIIYYYQIWADSLNFKYLLISAIFAIAGNLYRSSFAVIYAVLLFYSLFMIIMNRKSGKEFYMTEIKGFIFFIISSLGVLIPSVAIVKLNSGIMPGAVVERLWNAAYIFRYVKPMHPYFPSMQSSVTVLVLILAGCGIISLMFSKKSKNFLKTGTLGILWFGIYFTVFTLAHSHSVRHLVPAYPALVLILSIAVYKIFQAIKYRTLKILLSILIALYLLSYSIVEKYAPLKIFWSNQGANIGIANSYFPYDSLFDYIKKNIEDPENLFAPMVCEPTDFYCYVKGVKRNRIINREFLNEEATVISDVINYLEKNKVKYFIIPYLINARYPYDIINIPNMKKVKWLEKPEFQNLIFNENQYFSTIKTFEFEKFGLAVLLKKNGKE
ncbi:MAG TPA: hypothetical protein PKY81_04780 [bacterium]|nr:hypothetical protein [bacterium]HPN30250.1 hypothetical protein [bacterium]